MNHEEQMEVLKEEFNGVAGLITTKGREYATNEEVLADFKEVGEELGLEPEQVWAVYAAKHWRAIQSYIREGSVKSEAIQDRIRDLTTYSILLQCLLIDKQEDGELSREQAEAWKGKVPDVEIRTDRDTNLEKRAAEAMAARRGGKSE